MTTATNRTEFYFYFAVVMPEHLLDLNPSAYLSLVCLRRAGNVVEVGKILT